MRYNGEVPRLWLGALFVSMILGVAPIALAQTHVLTAERSATSTELSTTTEETATSTPPFDPLNPDDVEARVRAAFADTPVMIDIARCESGFRQYDSTGHPLYGGSGGMVGVFQEAAAIHASAAKAMGLDINTLGGNIAYARYLYEQEGTAPWLASSACWSPISSTLGLGSTGPQVLKLQRLLNEHGYTIATDGPGSPGHETDYYGELTDRAVRRFQCAQDLLCSGSEKSDGYGMVGPKTRLALLSIDSTANAPSSDLTDTQ